MPQLPLTMKSTLTTLAAGLVLAFAAPAFAADSVATLSAQQGTVLVNQGDEIITATEAQPLQAGDRVMVMEGGRAEITAGRGSFIESFPLFGYELANYGELFEEKLELLVELLKEKPVTWSGRMRASLTNQEVYPKTERGAIPLRVGVGGSPDSVVRAARLGIPMALAIIGGDPARFAPYSNLYKEQLAKFGHAELPVSIHSPGFIADNDHDAVEAQWPHYETAFGRIGKERGWGPTTKMHFISEVNGGSMYVGSPEKVAKKIAYAIESVGASRFDLKYANGPMPHSKLMKAIELYGTKVVPLVKELLS